MFTSRDRASPSDSTVDVSRKAKRYDTQVEKYFWPGEITRQIYHWQILPIIFEFSLWSHSSKRISNKLANGFANGFFCFVNGFVANAIC